LEREEVNQRLLKMIEYEVFTAKEEERKQVELEEQNIIRN
jgi:hypothetical protein